MTTTERLALILLALLPVLNAICGMAALNLTLIYLNKDRTTKVLFYALAFWVLSVVLLLSGIERNTVEFTTKSILQTARSVAFFLFVFLVIIGQIFDWIDTLTFMSAKDKTTVNADITGAARALVLAAETSIIAAEQAKRAVIAVEKEHAPEVKNALQT